MLIKIDSRLSGDTNDTCRKRQQVNVHPPFVSIDRDALTTGGTSTSVTSLLGLLVATPSEIVGTGVNDQGPLTLLSAHC